MYSYVMDANTFIEAFRRYYSFGVCPGFWAALLHHHDVGSVCSIDRVKTELLAASGPPDALATWAADTTPAAFFQTTNTQAIADEYAKIARWLYEPAQKQYSEKGKKEFLGGADPWIIAYGKVHGTEVITHEVLNPNIERKVPIPNVCQAFGVRYANSFSMLARINAAFHFTPPLPPPPVFNLNIPPSK